MTSPVPNENTDPVLVLAADEGFAMPLAATVRSVIDTVRPDRTLTIYILDGGLSDATKVRLLRSWRSPRPHRFEWIKVGPEAFEGIEAKGHVNHMTYYRIIIPRVLPQTTERAIYLDADLVVRTDIGRLWEADLGDHPCMAVQDPAAPYLDASKVVRNIDRCMPYLAAVRPIFNFETLGLSASTPYFNGGILLLNVAAWRQRNISEQLISCLHENKEFVLWWDQYALNVVLADQWKPLDLRWNQVSHIYHFPTWEDSPLDEATFQSLHDDPYIVHFTSPVKPWHPECLHPYRHEFFRSLDRTEWKGWRPPRIRLFKSVCRSGYQRIREHLRSALRRTKRLLSGRLMK